MSPLASWALVLLLMIGVALILYGTARPGLPELPEVPSLPVDLGDDDLAHDCPWCPPGCKQCVGDRDCECYAHQDEPDSHVSALSLPPYDVNGDDQAVEL
jgi:hypothetical protein